VTALSSDGIMIGRMTESLLGRPLWYELLTTDMKAAEAFYTNVVGWTTMPTQGTTGPYTIFKNSAGNQVAGVMTRPEGMNVPPHWVMYIGVPKLETAVSDIEQRGGSAMSPVIDVPNVGRMRTMKDPQGAMFEVFQPATPPSRPEAQPENGEVAWHELYTSDVDAAMKFYFDYFGWRATEPAFDMGPMGKYHVFGRSFSIGGMMTKPPEMPAPPHWGFYFRVRDVDASAERVKANGGQILNGPMEVPGGSRVVQAMDGQGAAFSLHQLKA
jgi:predicted enzyme related to lactoylglutathione lyase